MYVRRDFLYRPDCVVRMPGRLLSNILVSKHLAGCRNLDPAYLVLSLWVLGWVHSEMGVETGACPAQVSFDLMHILIWVFTKVLLLVLLWISKLLTKSWCHHDSVPDR